MYRLFLLLLLSPLLVAQESPTPAPATRNPGQNSAVPMEYQGCVIRSTGNIMLAAPDGKDFKLISSSRSLDAYVGQEVKVRASSINPGDPSSSEHRIESERQNQPLTLDVQEIAKVSERCSSPKK